MNFQARLTFALLAIAAVPLAILGYGVRREFTKRIDAEAARQVSRVRADMTGGVARLIADDRRRLESFAAELARDSRLGTAMRSQSPLARLWLVDQVAATMRVTGLAVLRVQDAAGRTLSIVEDPNDPARKVESTTTAIGSSPVGAAVVDVRGAGTPIRALVTMTSFTVGTDTFRVVGGSAFDSVRVARLSPDTAIKAHLRAANAPVTEGAMAIGTLPLVDELAGETDVVQILVIPDVGPTQQLREEVTRSFLIALGGSVLVAIVAAALLGRVVSTPIDEFVGRAALKAERATAMGDMARQVNHDIKNGLTPIRNVLRHLSQVAEKEPASLATVYSERKATLESGVDYLDQLARTYAKLSPAVGRAVTDARPILREVAASVTGATVDLRVPDSLPNVRADGVVVRRIVDNLVSNATEALEGRPGTVSIVASTVDGRVRITVADTGRGMTKQELDRAFDDFFTTKASGTGLGLSVVRRLVLEIGGSVRAETSPGQGSTFTVEIPAADAT